MPSILRNFDRRVSSQRVRDQFHASHSAEAGAAVPVATASETKSEAEATR